VEIALHLLGPSLYKTSPTKK